jgi:hypothetical protein
MTFSSSKEMMDINVKCVSPRYVDEGEIKRGGRKEERVGKSGVLGINR